MGNAHHPRLSRWAVLIKELRSASLNAQKHCPPYTKDFLISRLPHPLDAPSSLSIAIAPATLAQVS